jgi:hypothetical protein
MRVICWWMVRLRTVPVQAWSHNIGYNLPDFRGVISHLRAVAKLLEATPNRASRRELVDPTPKCVATARVCYGASMIVRSQWGRR